MREREREGGERERERQIRMIYCYTTVPSYITTRQLSTSLSVWRVSMKVWWT